MLASRQIQTRILVFLMFCAKCLTNFNQGPFVKIVVKVNDGYRQDVEKIMAEYNLSFYRLIFKNVYTFAKTQKNENEVEKIYVDELQQKLSGKTTYLYQSKDLNIRTLKNYLADETGKWPDFGLRNSGTLTSAMFNDEMENSQNCIPEFDPMFGIDEAWNQNITGKGVVIAIVDVGVDGDHPKLRNNIYISLSWNYVDDNEKFEPEYYSDIPHSMLLTNHGISCAGLAAGKSYQSGKCKSCGCGVAPDATIAVAKVGTVQKSQTLTYTVINTEPLCRGLAGHPDAVDIFSNSLNLNKPLEDIDLCFHDVIKRNYYEGRNCKGSIMVFVADPPGNGFVNNIYTIAVGDMGVNGTLPNDHQANSAVLVSVFGSGKKKDDIRFITDIHTKLVNSGWCCLRGDFGGQSAGTAIVSGMIALVLQVNPQLTARDVKNILVESASNRDITEESSFKTNAAGYKYHEVIGFGYPNVAKMVKLAKTWAKMSALQSITYTCKEIGEIAEIDVSVGQINRTEQVEFSASFDMLENTPMTLVAISPSQTRSVLFANITSLNGSRVCSTFLSNHFWGENPSGKWQIQLLGRNKTRHLNLNGWLIHALDMTLYGTGFNNVENLPRASKDSSSNDICDAFQINIPHHQCPPDKRSAAGQILTTYTSLMPVILFKMLTLLY